MSAITGAEMEVIRSSNDAVRRNRTPILLNVSDAQFIARIEAYTNVMQSYVPSWRVVSSLQIICH